MRAIAPCLVALLLALLRGTPAVAAEVSIVFESDELVPQAKTLLSARAREMQKWARSSPVVDAVTAQNAQPMPLPEIHEIDARWVSNKDGGLAAKLMSNSCALTLRSYMESAPPGYYREGFVADAQGALVCATERTSDYWQGDEEKWTRPFRDRVIFVGAVRFDESTAQPLIQISVPILADGKPIGVLVVGKTISSLQIGQRPEGQLQEE